MPVAIRLAGEEDAEIIHAGLLMIARHLKAEGKVTSTVEDIRRHGFGARPAFEVLIAEAGLAAPLVAEAKDPSPTPSHKGEGLNPAIRSSHKTDRLLSVIDGHRDRRQVNPSPLWEGVGEGASASSVFAGMCLFFPSFSTWRGQKGAYIQDIVVDERFRGSGVGVALVRRTAAHVRAQGGTYLRLSVDAENVSAQHFYERLGLSWSRDERIHAAYGDAFQLLAGLHESGV
ncbi:GNAT family N-acetyltransferase [Pararhizobium sp. O133]|uniref:GNAT family N-acetyltransferase n=1 Tax=Pararhizobium sp. O133 TaxID=3449278 RepID=UPI003F685B08